MDDSFNRENDQGTCPVCGSPLDTEAGGVTESMCPRCLMAKAMQPTAAEGAQIGQRPEAPSLEVVSAAFPDLEIEELIGQGGMGAVFKARQKSLDRWVALKILPQSLAMDGKFAERFESEAKALAALNHPNIVTIHDSGCDEGFYFLLMEFVDGVNLRELLKSRKLSPEEALTIVPPLCDALQFAHDRGIVHRDIKPENLLLDKDGRVKVADFGIAKILGGGARGSDNSAGTPGYMAPEQKDQPDRVDNRADIYSLGVVFYEMLTGERPDSIEGTLQAPSKKVVIDVRLDEIVLRALEDEPEQRWQTIADLRTQVETLVDQPQSKNSVSNEQPPLPPLRPLGVWRVLLFVLAALVTGAFALPVRKLEAAEVGMNESVEIGIPSSPWILDWKNNVAGGWQSGTELLPLALAWPSWVCAAIAVITWIVFLVTLPRYDGKPSLAIRKGDGSISPPRAIILWFVLFFVTLLPGLLMTATIASFGRGAPSPLSSPVISLIFATIWIVASMSRRESPDSVPNERSTTLPDESDEWRITCLKCGNSKTYAELGGIRRGAVSREKRKFVHCSTCGKMRMAIVHRSRSAPLDPIEQHERSTTLLGFWALFGILLGGVLSMIPFLVLHLVNARIRMPGESEQEGTFSVGWLLAVDSVPILLVIAGCVLGVIWMIRKFSSGSMNCQKLTGTCLIALALMAMPIGLAVLGYEKAAQAAIQERIAELEAAKAEFLSKKASAASDLRFAPLQDVIRSNTWMRNKMAERERIIHASDVAITRNAEQRALLNRKWPKEGKAWFPFSLGVASLVAGLWLVTQSHKEKRSPNHSLEKSADRSPPLLD